MLNFLASLILASLLIPSGFNFFNQKAIDYSFRESKNQPFNSPQRIVNKSFGLKTTAKSILAIDNNSGAILYSKDSNSVLPIASLTKLLTALVILDTYPDWDQIITIEESDQRSGGIVYLLVGEQITVKDLFYLMLVASSNEAAAALARNSGIADFPSAMNKKAKVLGMTDSYFIDPSGLEPQNISTTIDLVKLAKAAFSQPDIGQALTREKYGFETLNTKRIGQAVNTDQLLSSFLNRDTYQIIGAKTGYLDEAGYCLLLQIKKSDGPSLTLVLLGMETMIDRWQEAKGLVDWIFKNYQWP